MKHHHFWKKRCGRCLYLTILLCVGWYHGFVKCFQVLRIESSPHNENIWQYFDSKQSINRGIRRLTTVQNSIGGVDNFVTENDEITKWNDISNKENVWMNHSYKVIHKFVYDDQESEPTNIVEILTKSSFYSSKTQARKACQKGAILILSDRNQNYSRSGLRENAWSNKPYNLTSIVQNDQLKIANCYSEIQRNDIVLIQSRLTPDRNHYYPVEVTKNILPPFLLMPSYNNIGNEKINDCYDDDENIFSYPCIQVVYEDDYIAVINKPENITTIIHSNGQRKINNNDQSFEVDLQSLLGFLLHPSPHEPLYHPRPVHRLDRRTSGLILIAKTKNVMRYYSHAFSSHTRRIIKTYTALVFHHRPPNSIATDSTSSFIQNDEIWMQNSSKDDYDKKWKEIDHPIDGKSAKSRWRYSNHYSNISNILRKTNQESTSPFRGDNSNEQNPRYKLSLLEVRPLTGRTHQIRRHLAYCLSLPIVGDAKYDKGARALRTNGMYLCCNSLEFPLYNTSTIEASTKHQVVIPLPSKFNQTFQQQGKLSN